MSPDTSVPRRDIDFVLFEVLQAVRLCERERFADHSAQTFAAALDTAATIATERFAPHYQQADANEPRVVDGKVSVAPEVRDALRAFAQAGFAAATHDQALGGMQLPFSVAMSCWALFKAANIGTETYASLALGVANMLREHGTPAQQQRFLPPLLDGRWLGTMVLTEPQAGSSLGDIRATATPLADGRYSLRGQKIFITAGDHELTDNIVHLVLARLPQAPAGTRGLSLFIVPKRRVLGDGSVGENNDVALAGLIHKMGSRATTSAMLNFGERGECIGELLGPPGGGLACMFGMMNEARVNVGVCATMLGLAGYRRAVDYAKERVQGRDADGRPVAIIGHADVKRMLLSQKAVAEGALALCLYGATLADDEKTAPGETARAQAGAVLGLLTPVIKSWPAKYCTEANVEAIQVHGGYGYTRDHAVEQIYRDNRLNAIHEGTHGIQALDLLGRKVGADAGRAFALLAHEIRATAATARSSAPGELPLLADELDEAIGALVATTDILRNAMVRDPTRALANAGIYLDLVGHAAVGWMWLRQAIVATAALEDAQGDDAAFYLGKLAAARYFFRYLLPQTTLWHSLLRGLDDTCLGAQPDWF